MTSFEVVEQLVHKLHVLSAIRCDPQHRLSPQRRGAERGLDAGTRLDTEAVMGKPYSQDLLALMWPRYCFRLASPIFTRL